MDFVTTSFSFAAHFIEPRDLLFSSRATRFVVKKKTEYYLHRLSNVSWIQNLRHAILIFILDFVHVRARARFINCSIVFPLLLILLCTEIDISVYWDRCNWTNLDSLTSSSLCGALLLFAPYFAPTIVSFHSSRIPESGLWTWF